MALPRLLASAACSVLLVLLGSGASWAQGGPAVPPPPPPPGNPPVRPPQPPAPPPAVPAAQPDDLGAPPADGKARPMRWVEGFAGGAAEARRTGRILFVAVTRERPTCPKCKALKARVFDKPEAAAISDRFVAVRIRGGDDATADVDAFMRRYGIDSYPTLLAMTPDGGVLTMIPTFTDDGKPLGVPEFLAALDDATKKEQEFQAKRQELLAQDDPSGWAEISKWHVERAEFGAAAGVHLRILQRQPTVENYGMLAWLHQKNGDRQAERKTLDAMLERFPQSPERIEWRVRLATMELGSEVKSEAEFAGLVDRHVAALKALLATVETEGSLSDQSEVHWRIADFLRQKDDYAGMKEHLLWIADRDPTNARAAPARLRVAYAAFQKEDLETSVTNLEALIARYADSPEAAQARDVLPQVKEELARKQAKPQ